MTETAYERVCRALAAATGYNPPNPKAGWKCPAHTDNSPSLSVSNGSGKVLIHCQAGCDLPDVLRVLGLEQKDLFDEEMMAKGAREIVAAYPYTDEEGHELFQAVRFLPKDFRQRHYNPADPKADREGWVWNIAGRRRVLYRLQDVIEAVKAGVPVYIVEGEKDVHALDAVGEVATCCPMGAGKWKAEYGYAEFFKGADVIIVADQDGPGISHAADVEASLQGVARSVRVVAPAVGKDAADHLAAGKTVAEFVGDEQPMTKVETLRSKLLSVNDLAALPPPEPLIDGIIMRDRLAVLWGKPGSGKSFVALDWGLSIGVGAWWMGHGVSQGRVLLIAAEGVGGLHQRVEAWKIEHQIYDIPTNQFVILPVAPNLLESEWAAAVVELAKSEDYCLVIIDTLARVMVGGEENGTRDMGIVIEVGATIQRETGAAVLFVHHDTKEGSTMRGSSALIGAADTSIECKADGQAMVLKCEKQKDDRPFEPIRLWRESVASSCVIRSQTAVGANSGELTASEATLRQTSWECCGTDGLPSSELLKVSGLAHGTFYRALKSLLNEGELVNVGSEKRPRYRPVEVTKSE